MKVSKLYTLLFFAGVLILGGCARSYYNAGNRFYNQLAYSAAIDKYKKALSKKDMPEAKEMLAEAYMKEENTAQAETYFNEVVNLPNAKPSDEMDDARAMMANGHYADAKAMLKKYLDQVPSDQMAQYMYASCDSISKWKADSASWLIETPNINSSSSMNPTPYKGGLMFASDRDDTRKTFEWTDKPFLALFYAKETATPGSFDKAKELSGPVNGIYHNGAPCVSPDGKTLYFTRNDYMKKKVKKSSNGVVLLGIYQATWKDTSWTDVKPVSFDNKDYSCGHPALSADGKTMYFTSDMPGGYGGADIYMVKMEGNDWGKPVNLGATINTPLDDMFPTIDGDTLYFSSNGHPGMGGLDIFKSVRGAKGTWSTPVNMGYPINSPHDDFGLIWSKDHQSGYLTSNRNSSDGLTDNILRFVKPELIFKLEVLTVNKNDNMKPLSGSTVELLNKRTGQRVTKLTGSDGMAYFDSLNVNTEFTALGSHKGFFSNSADVSTMGKTKSEDLGIKLVLELEVMPDTGVPIKIPNIYYDYDKADILPQAALELDSLVKKLKDNPTILIELASHCDCHGSDAYNDKLSQRRAEAAVKYIVSKGINKKRITAKGYGKRKLLDNCDCATCTEEQNAKNRRTEFIIKGFSDKFPEIMSTPANNLYNEDNPK